MLDFGLSPEQEEFRSTLRSFFAHEAPIDEVIRLDAGESSPSDHYTRMAQLGLTGLTIPEEHGGADAGEVMVCLATEEVGRASATLLYYWIPTVTCSRSIATFGTSRQQQELLPAVAAGDLRFALALSEPEAGSDLTGLSTRAVADGDHFVITGQKVFVTGADSADLLFVFARTDPDATTSKALTVFLVPRDAPGVSIQPLRKLAGQGTHTCEVFLDDVRVSDADVVGEVGGGMAVIRAVLDYERITNGAQSIGLAQGAFDLAAAYARERVQFGKPIVEQQAVGHMLADMATEIEAARLLVWRAAWKLEQGLPCSQDASMAKVMGSEVGTRCASRGMQILGGYSYMVEYGMERYYREAKLNEIVAGTNEIQRNILARQIARAAPVAATH